MSIAFVPHKGRPPPSPAQIQKMLDENSQLIQAIADYQNKGKANECIQFQQILHRNLVYLASIADSTQNIQQLLPPPQGAIPAGQQHMGGPGTQGPPMTPADAVTPTMPGHQGGIQHGMTPQNSHPMGPYNQNQNPPPQQQHMTGYTRPPGMSQQNVPQGQMMQPSQGMPSQQYGATAGMQPAYPPSQQPPMMGQQGSPYRPQQATYPQAGGPQQTPSGQYAPGPTPAAPYSGQNPPTHQGTPASGPPTVYRQNQCGLTRS